MIRRRLAFAALLLLIGAMPARSEFVEVETKEIEAPPQANMPGLKWMGGIAIAAKQESLRRAVGNLSGLEYLPDGRLVTISDEGFWFLLKPKRAVDGNLTGLASVEFEPMLDEKGDLLIKKPSPTADDKYWTDAESVRLRPGGGLLVTFERNHRVWRYGETGSVDRWIRSAATPAPTPAGHFSEQPPNGGAESMAVWPDGETLLISEHQEPRKGQRAAWLGGQGSYRSLVFAADRGNEADLRIEDRFSPSDAVALPSGDLLVLHHRFVRGTCETAARVERVAKALIAPGATMRGKVIAEWNQRLGPVDNMEGIAVGGGKPGETLVWIVSDHNGGLPGTCGTQRTLLMLFQLQ